MVLDRLARIEGILNDQTARLSQIQLRGGDLSSPAQLSTSPYSALESTSSITYQHRSQPEPPRPLLLRPQLSTLNVPPGGYTSIDSVFSLPVILNLLPHSHLKVRHRSYLIEADLQDTLDTPARHPTTPNLSREYTTKLLDSYLSIVYPKNPILNRADLRSAHLEVLRSGPLWDTRTCLVFIVLALGAIAIVDHDPNPIPAGAHHTDYLDAALQRFGFVLMKTDIEAIQTTYLFGYNSLWCEWAHGRVYYMYDMKGLQAGTVFHDAAIKCRTYLKWTTVPETAIATVSAMEKSIFWSCLKTEWYGSGQVHADW
jgi:hypothetical protein